MDRKPNSIWVRAAFYKEPMRVFPGYDSCSPLWNIGKVGNEWQILHAKTGLLKMCCKTLREARYFCGIFGALPVDWEKPSGWEEWQKRHKFLMPWFEATGQVLRVIG